MSLQLLLLVLSQQSPLLQNQLFNGLGQGVGPSGILNPVSDIQVVALRHLQAAGGTQ